MTDLDKQLLLQFISRRQDSAHTRTKENTRYQAICDRQQKTEADVDIVLSRMTQDEQHTIRSHFEGETERTCYQFNEVYVQGLRDCVKIMNLLGLYGAETAL